jgi:hypothetical protein
MEPFKEPSLTPVQPDEDIDISSPDSVDNTPESPLTPGAALGGGGKVPKPGSDTVGIKKKGSGNSINSNSNSNNANDPRRAKACNHCRMLKVRCIPSNPNDLSQPCVRCSKGKRECVFHVGPWKRSRRTDSRVAALEKKLEVLTAALNGQQVSSEEIRKIMAKAEAMTGALATAEPLEGNKANNSTGNTGFSNVMPDARMPSTSAAAANPVRKAPLRRPVGSKSYGPRASVSSTPDSMRDSDPGSGRVRMKDVKEIREKMISLWNKMTENSTLRLADIAKQDRMQSPTYETDVISQGLITVAEAQERLNKYRLHLFKKYTLIEVSEELTLEILRRENPLLFLTVMAVTSVALRGQGLKKVCITIQNQAVDAVIYETMMLGRKNLEILKCLILLNLWYNTPETYHHQKSHLITHLCTTLAVDLGLGGTPFESQQSNSMKYDRLIRPDVLLNPRTAECRKLWLCVYISSVHVSMIIKRPVYLMWSRYTEECCKILEQPDRSLMERRVAAIARLHHLTEEITCALQSMDSKAPPDLNDPRTQYIIKEFELKLKALEDRANLGSQLFLSALHLVHVLLHEFAMYVPLSERLGRSPYSEYSLAIGTMQLSTHTAQAIGWCYSGAIKCLELIASQTVEELAMMPLFCYMRMAFSASALLKLRTLYLTTPDFHQVCTIKSASLEPINRLIDKLDSVIAEYPFANLAVNFCFVLHVLICHFDRQLHYFYNPTDRYQMAANQTSSTNSASTTTNPQHININSTAVQEPRINNSKGNNNNNQSNSSSSSAASTIHSTHNTPGSISGVNDGIIPPILNNEDNYSSLPRSNAIEQRYSEQRRGGGASNTTNANAASGINNNNTMAGKLEFLSAIATSPLPQITNSFTGPYRNSDESGLLPRPPPPPMPPQSDRAINTSSGGNATFFSPGSSGNSGSGDNGIESAKHSKGYPNWLVTDDFWKDLVSGAEALTGFDLF